MIVVGRWLIHVDRLWCQSCGRVERDGRSRIPTAKQLCFSLGHGVWDAIILVQMLYSVPILLVRVVIFQNLYAEREHTSLPRLSWTPIESRPPGAHRSVVSYRNKYLNGMEWNGLNLT
jgi:hypothetical protein